MGLFSKRMALAAAIIGVVFVGEAAAESAGSWYLVVPPLIPERQALIRAYTATSEADVKAAVEGLPEDRRVLLATKAYTILTIPTVVDRTEALLDALQDTSAPTPRWRQVATFESAASCERERELALQSFEGDAWRVRAADRTARSSPARTGKYSRACPRAERVGACPSRPSPLDSARDRGAPLAPTVPGAYGPWP